MDKLGDMAIPLVLTRDQVRLIRGMLATTAIRGELLPVFQDVKNVLDNAETAGTIAHANAQAHASQPRCHCGKPVYTSDGFSRGMCEVCSLERCDVPDGYAVFSCERN